MVTKAQIIELLEMILRSEETDEEMPEWRLSRKLRLSTNGTIEIVERNMHGNRSGDICHRKVSVFELDPSLIEIADYDADRPYLTIPTKFLRERIIQRSYSVNGYARTSPVSEFYVPLRRVPTEDELQRLVGAIAAFQRSASIVSLSATDIQAMEQRAKHFKEFLERLANSVDFTPLGGGGFFKQKLSIDLGTMTLELREFRRYSVNVEGREVTSRIPLYALDRRNYLLVSGPNPNPGAMGRGVPPVHIKALTRRVPIKQHFEAGDGFEAFDRDSNHLEEIYVSTLDDVVAFGKALSELIFLAREFGFHRQCSQ